MIVCVRQLRSHVQPQVKGTRCRNTKVTLHHTTVEIVEADNPYQAAVVASGRHGDSVEIAHVAPAVGRPVTASKGARKVKKVAKKRRKLSPEARAQLAKNLVKARAARARNLKAAKKSAPRKKAVVKKAKRAAKR